MSAQYIFCGKWETIHFYLVCDQGTTASLHHCMHGNIDGLSLLLKGFPNQ